MPLLTFPSPAVNGQLYPTNPLPGQTQYQWSSADQTWTIVGTSTGVFPGTYGDAYNVGQFTVDASGRITFAQDVPIAALTAPAAGANEEIQFNDNGVLGASPGLKWSTANSTLSASALESRTLLLNDANGDPGGGFIFNTSPVGTGESLIYNFYGSRRFRILTNGAGSPITFENAASGTPFMVRLLPGGAAELYHNGSKKFETTAAGANVTGNLEATGNLKTTAALQVSNNAQPSFVTGFAAPLAFTQSVIYRLPSGDGAPGNVLSTNGSGLLRWVAPGSSTAGGSSTQIQFNNGGVLAGSPNLTWSSSNVLSVGGRISATDAISTTGSGYFWSGWNPFAITGSSSGASVDYGTTGFYRYSTNASDKVLLGRYNPTGNITVDLTLGGDFYLRDLGGNNEFTVTGAGNVYAKGTLAVDSTISTNGQFHLNSSQFRIIGGLPGAGDVTLGNVSGPGGLTVRCGQSQSIDFTNENGTVTFASIDSTAATVPSLVAAGLTYPLGDGAAGEVLTTDGAGNLGWLAAAKVVAVPGSQGAPGNPGEIAAGAGYFYWYDGTNWQRVAAGPGGW